MSAPTEPTQAEADTAGLTICVVVATLGGGGAERVVIELARSWASAGHAVTITTLMPSVADEYSIPAGVERCTLDLSGTSRHVVESLWNTVARDRALRAFLLGKRPDVVVSFMDATNVRVLRATRRTGIPVVISEETDPTSYPLAWRWRVLRRALYPRADALVVHAEGLRSWANRVMLRRSRVHVVPNAIWLDIQPSAPRGTNDRYVVLGMGRLTHVKGFDVLLRAFAEVAPRAASWDLVIWGEGPERASLEALARELGIADRARFPGRTDDPAAAYPAADVFALPSRTEAFPLALVEAMASGLPVVASALRTGPSEVVENGNNGLLVRPDDPASLRDALERLIGDADLRSRLGAAATGVQSRYSRSSVAAQWEHLLRATAAAVRVA